MEKYFYKFQDYKVAQILGKDAIDFLQRISTNDFNIFKNKNIITTCFLNDKGRVIDVCTILKDNENLYLVSTSSDFKKTIDHLNKYIITDDVELKVENSTKIEKYFESSNELSIEEYNYQNIMNGRANLNDLTIEQYNPLELNLKEYISFSKGCYIGQEIVARLDTYNKTSKHLVVLKNNHLEYDYLGNEIQTKNNEKCGKIFSSQKYDNASYYLAIVSNKITDSIFYNNGLNANFIKVKDFV